MVKTTLVKLKDDEGKEYASIFGDLTELYAQVEESILASDKVIDLAEGLLVFRRSLASLITESMAQYTEKKNEESQKMLPPPSTGSD